MSPSYFKWWHFIVFVLAILSQVAAQTPPVSEEAEAVATTPDTVAVEEFADDRAIEERLSTIFNATGWFQELDVQATNGFVRINGRADSDEHSRWAEEIAGRTKDVVGVSSNLAVESRLDIERSMDVVNSSLGKLWRDLLQRLPLLIAGLLLVALTWVWTRLQRFLLGKLLKRRERVRPSFRELLLQLSTIGTWLIGLMLATVVAFPGMTPSKALTVLGLGSVAIGFAFKDIFENFFAGMLILWKYPFDIGDFIETEGTVGSVQEITVRNTMLRRTDGQLVVIPNAQLFKSNVEVLTDLNLRRVRIICGVAYDEDVDVAQQVISAAVGDCKSVSDKYPVQIFANEFADSSVNFEVTWWTEATPVAIRRSRDEVLRAIKANLDREQIEIPFPYRTLTFKEPLGVLQQDESLTTGEA